jgi:hypothetical protein
MIKLPAMTAQLSDESWQKLAEETRCEVNRITNLRNLLNLQDLADIAVACDPQSIIDKMGRTQDTFMNLGGAISGIGARSITAEVQLVRRAIWSMGPS